MPSTVLHFRRSNLAIARLPEMAAASGIAAAGFTRSHHFGVAGRHVERLAEAGLVALAFGNTPKAMAPWGGKQPLYGTNPIAFAAPHRGQPPIVVDMALSQVARGKILTAAQKGEAIPEGWAVDENGQPTTDAAAALKGALQPIGGAKGAALALMVEVLAVALTGARFGFEASSFFDADGPPPGVGQFLIAIDPGAFGGADVFADRMAALAGMIEGDGDARLPGSRRIALREKAAREGVTVDSKLLAEVRALAGVRWCQTEGPDTIVALLPADLEGGEPDFGILGRGRLDIVRTGAVEDIDRHAGDRHIGLGPIGHVGALDRERAVDPHAQNPVALLGCVEHNFLLELHPLSTRKLEAFAFGRERARSAILRNANGCPADGLGAPCEPREEFVTLLACVRTADAR